MSIPEVGKKIRVTVPSTTANLGPGFDCLGAALDLYNEFIFTSCLLYTSPSPRDREKSRMPSSA